MMKIEYLNLLDLGDITSVFLLRTFTIASVGTLLQYVPDSFTKCVDSLLALSL